LSPPDADRSRPCPHLVLWCSEFLCSALRRGE
jgi:hypothetical protein